MPKLWVYYVFISLGLIALTWFILHPAFDPNTYFRWYCTPIGEGEFHCITQKEMFFLALIGIGMFDAVIIGCMIGFYRFVKKAEREEQNESK